MSKVAVTGAAKGIGLETCRQLQARGDVPIALCRTATPELTALGCRVVEGVDVTSDGVGALLREVLGEEQLDGLVHNAGAMLGIGETLEAGVDLDKVRLMHDLHVLGPLRVTQALLPNLREGGKVLLLSSLMGSIEARGTPAAPGPGFYGYASSKAGANMVVKCMSIELAPKKIAVRSMHPGVVDTAMTQQYGFPDMFRANEATKDLVKTAAEGAQNVLSAFDSLTMDTTGTFVNAEECCRAGAAPQPAAW